jgi:hypothetical protein
MMCVVVVRVMDLIIIKKKDIIYIIPLLLPHHASLPCYLFALCCVLAAPPLLSKINIIYNTIIIHIL